MCSKTFLKKVKGCIKLLELLSCALNNFKILYLFISSMMILHSRRWSCLNGFFDNKKELKKRDIQFGLGGKSVVHGVA